MSNASYIRLKGKRCIGLVRCSTVGQADTSIPDQIAALRKFAEEHGLIIVDIIILPGVSGSIPGNRDDLEKLIERKLERDDFEVLLVFDITRLTRGGARHGAKIEYDFLAAGVEIVYVMEQFPEGAAGEIFRSFQFQSANEQARAISKNTSRGSMSALEQGRLSHLPASAVRRRSALPRRGRQGAVHPSQPRRWHADQARSADAGSHRAVRPQSEDGQANAEHQAVRRGRGARARSRRGRRSGPSDVPPPLR